MSTETNKEVLGVLTSFYNKDLGKVVVEHLVSIELLTVTSDALYQAVVKLMKGNDIPWPNLASILMNSCNVTRGSKSGLEVRIRKGKVPHLIDIHGDICHHIHML